MAEPEIALVFSAEEWVEQLHRHCSDHGGARVRQLLVDPELALDEEYSTLVTGHRWPALTPALVDDLHRHGRSVLGVWDRGEPESRLLLSAAGVDGLVASDVATSEIVDAIAALPRPSDAAPAFVDDLIPAASGRRVVVGGPAGAGTTEIAIGLAAAVGRGGVRPALVDLDLVAPAVAPRLGLPPEPNLRNAIDAVEFRVGSVHDAIARVATFDVVAGLAGNAPRARLRAPEALRVVDALAREYGVVIIDLATGGEDSAVAHGLLGVADAIVAVGVASPVGLARFVNWLAETLPSVGAADLHIVMNRAPGQAFRRGELHDEVVATVRPQSLTFVPTDRRIDEASWSGAVVGRGPFTRALRDLARRIGAPGERAR